MTDKDSLLAEKNKLQAELSAFHAAMERERKPDWEKWHKDLADRLENPSPDRTVAVDDARTAARELRYVADSFTLKANFVPAELRIKELEAALQQAHADSASMRTMLNTVYEWCVSDNPSDIDSDEVKKILDSTDSGKALLAQLEGARYLLNEVVATNAGWFDHRRDAWLNPKEGK